MITKIQYKKGFVDGVRGKFRVWNAYIKKWEKPKITNVRLYPRD